MPENDGAYLCWDNRYVTTMHIWCLAGKPIRCQEYNPLDAIAKSA
jgi:hypothetical protein